MKVLGRTAGGLALGIGVLVGCFVLGDVGAIAGVVLAMLGFQALTRKVEGPAYVAGALATTAGLVTIAWIHGLGATELGLGHTTWITGLLWSAGIVLGIGAVIGIAGGIPRLHKYFADDRNADANGLLTTRRVLMDIPFGTVLVEEFAFRGVLLALVTQVWGTVWAVAITSLLFGLWHIGPALEMHDAHQEAKSHVLVTVGTTVLFTGLSGVVFAGLRLFTGSLLPPAALHWAGNGTGLVVSFFVHRRLRRQQREWEHEAHEHAHDHDLPPGEQPPSGAGAA